MKIYSSLWNADDWATRGGLEKTDWAKAPFVASYRGFHIDGCEASVQAKFCATQGKRWWDQKEFQDLDALQYRRLRWVRQKYTIYNYCTDRVRFPTLPPECKRDRDIWSYISNRRLTCELLDLHVILSLFVYLQWDGWCFMFPVGTFCTNFFLFSFTFFVLWTTTYVCLHGAMNTGECDNFSCATTCDCIAVMKSRLSL